jgi:hypothetical protein
MPERIGGAHCGLALNGRYVSARSISATRRFFGAAFLFEKPMANTFGFFDREIKVATSDLEPAAINAALARFARQSVAEVIANGEASAQYEKYVGGRQGAAEESVRIPEVILYEFLNWRVVIEATIEELKRRGPRSKSGRFAASYIVIVAGSVTTDFDNIPSKSEVQISNSQPYVRKAEAGLLGIPRRRLFDGTKGVMARRFGGKGGPFRFETKFLYLSSGIAPNVPYVLKGSQGRRKGRQSGDALTYPAIIVNAN